LTGVCYQVFLPRKAAYPTALFLIGDPEKTAWTVFSGFFLCYEKLQSFTKWCTVM